jgi:hypothetical protein
VLGASTSKKTTPTLAQNTAPASGSAAPIGITSTLTDNGTAPSSSSSTTPGVPNTGTDQSQTAAATDSGATTAWVIGGIILLILVVAGAWFFLSDAI